jgi:hypothetical protein
MSYFRSPTTSGAVWAHRASAPIPCGYRLPQRCYRSAPRGAPCPPLQTLILCRLRHANESGTSPAFRCGHCGGPGAPPAMRLAAAYCGGSWGFGGDAAKPDRHQPCLPPAPLGCSPLLVPHQLAVSLGTAGLTRPQPCLERTQCGRGPERLRTPHRPGASTTAAGGHSRSPVPNGTPNAGSRPSVARPSSVSTSTLLCWPAVLCAKRLANTGKSRCPAGCVGRGCKAALLAMDVGRRTTWLRHFHATTHHS